VIVLSYHHASEKVKGSFLLYKNGAPVDLKQRRELYTKAAKLVEASKDSEGYYHINGNVHAGHYESDIYEVVGK
jgi:hypothetical protein